MTVSPEKRKKGRAVRKVFLGATVGLICLSIVLAVFHRTPWIVPATEKARKNPLMASDENLRAAKKIYGEQCDNCHGKSGKGDGSDAMMYDPAPSDLTDAAKIDKLTDGEIFYQISEGRKPMPSFKKKLTEEQRWQLVLLVRVFAAGAKESATVKQSDASGTQK
jgi:mono/diheme cytochrome c family protein